MYDFPIPLRGAFCRAVGGVTGSLFCREGKTIVSNPPVISVLDDDASVRIGTENLLSSLGCTVHTFASAEEFLRSAHFSDTSCVIADVQMPAMSGVELQALVLAQGHHLPFIFITARAVRPCHELAIWRAMSRAPS
jgi:CheY-like chemotaxis protein